MGFVHIDVEKNRVFTMPSALPFYLYQFSNEFARQAREYAAISCLELLRSDNLSRGPFTSQRQYDDIEQRLPFANYVSQNWGVHLNDAVDEETMNGILENDSLLETLSQLLHVSSQPISVSPRPYDNYPNGFGSRHFGAYFGLTIAFDKWSTQEDWAVRRDSWKRSPFHVCFRSPGLYERHVVFDLFEGENFSNLIWGGKLSKFRSEPENEDSENDDQGKPFRHEPVMGLPWKWGLDYYHDVKAFRDSVPGKNLKKLFTFSKDEIKVVDKDRKTPLHHFMADWSEDTLIALIQMTFDRDDAPEHGAEASESDNDSDAAPNSKRSLGERKFLPLVADNSGRTTLYYACERSVLFGTLAFGIAKWSPEHINDGIAIAASCGHAVLVNYLCEMIYEKPNSQGRDFELGQGVIEASKRGFTDIVRLLHQRRTTLGIQDDKGMSPLHHAAYGCHTDTVRFLLLEGTDPNQLDKAGRSPLFCACESGSDTIITLLREKGASATRANSDGQTLIHLAASRGNVDVVRRLLRLDGGVAQLRTPDPDAAELALQSPLHIAAREGHHAVVKLLVEEGFPIDSRDGDGRTPLSYACESGHLESVQVLLIKKRFVGVNSTDKNRRTPLSYAAAEGHVDVVAALVGQGGVDPNIKDVEGKTALIHAAQRGHNDTVVVLILLANNSSAVKAPVTRSFKELYSRFSNKPTGNIAVDVNMKDNKEHSAVFYLKYNGTQGKQGASNVARYIVEIGERPKPKALMDSGEGRAGEGDGDGNKPAENPERPMVDDDDQKAARRPGAVDTPAKDRVVVNADQKTGNADKQTGDEDAAQGSA
jgi:ankyrin repeat protein